MIIIVLNIAFPVYIVRLSLPRNCKKRKSKKKRKKVDESSLQLTHPVEIFEKRPFGRINGRTDGNLLIIIFYVA